MPFSERARAVCFRLCDLTCDRKCDP